jgi:hypothetical protein
MNPPIESANAEAPAPIPPVMASGPGFRRSKRTIWLALAAMALIALGIFAWFDRRFLLAGLDIVAEATGSRTTALLALSLGFLVLVWILVWMLFPIFVYLALRDLRRRTAALDLNTRLCASQLAQLTEERHGSRSPSSSKDSPPGPRSAG